MVRLEQPPASSFRPAPARPSPVNAVFVLSKLSLYGVSRQAMELAGRMNRDKYRLEVWVMSGEDELAPLVRDRGIPIYWLAQGKEVGVKGITALARRLSRQRPDLLFLLTPAPNIWGRIFGRLVRVPVIVGNCVIGAPQLQYEQWLWPLADHIVTNNLTVKEKMVSAYGIPRKRISVIRNGLDTHYFHPPKARPEGPPVLVCVARLHPDKDHITMFRAFKSVLEQFPEACLWLVGEGQARPLLEDWARRHLPAGSVRFCGGQLDVRPFLHQAALFVLSSISNASEASPSALLEAMAAGLPAVVSRVGGIAEVVVDGQTGLLVQERDPQALARAICGLLADPERLQAMGQAARRRAVAEFSFEKMVKSHEEIFDGLLGRYSYTPSLSPTA
ncbi:MAG: glycosyltransferase [Deltaproteobacteria bacterium]|nr:glycosyltransferase [Deltaproteobacteria bacterium]